MSSISFYDRLPDMECLSGDTLPEFIIEIEGDIPAGSTLQLILARSDDPTDTVVVKEAAKTAEGYKVQLTSDDTLALYEGVYFITFRLSDDNTGLRYLKLRGSLYVRATAQG